MSLVAEKEMAHIGETKGVKDHDHDLVHNLGTRLDLLWRYDQYIANAEGKLEIQNFWREMKNQEQNNVRRLKELISKEVQDNCF